MDPCTILTYEMDSDPRPVHLESSLHMARTPSQVSLPVGSIRTKRESNLPRLLVPLLHSASFAHTNASFAFTNASTAFTQLIQMVPIE